MVPTEQRLSQTSDEYINWLNLYHPTYAKFLDGKVVRCSVHDLDKIIAENKIGGHRRVDKDPQRVV